MNAPSHVSYFTYDTKKRAKKLIQKSNTKISSHKKNSSLPLGFTLQLPQNKISPSGNPPLKIIITIHTYGSEQYFDKHSIVGYTILVQSVHYNSALHHTGCVWHCSYNTGRSTKSLVIKKRERLNWWWSLDYRW